MIMETQNDPEFGKQVFECPHCHVTTTERWLKIYKEDKNRIDEHLTSINNTQLSDFGISECDLCHKQTIWFNKKIIEPIISPAPMAHKDMPNNVLVNFNEARDIVEKSPRAAAALLRLALEKLLPQLGAEGDDINKMIGNLVKKGY